MHKEKSTIQKEWFPERIRSKEIMSIYLSNGLCLRGRIVAYNAYSIFLRSAQGALSLVMKTNITTIQPYVEGAKPMHPRKLIKELPPSGVSGTPAVVRKPVVVTKKKVRHIDAGKVS